MHALINEGRAAGASLPHSHSQLVWMRERPPAVVEEGDLARREFDLLEGDRGPPRRRRELEVGSRGDLLAVCPPAGRVPYEVLILNGHVRRARGLRVRATSRRRSCSSAT